MTVHGFSRSGRKSLQLLRKLDRPNPNRIEGQSYRPPNQEEILKLLKTNRVVLHEILVGSSKTGGSELALCSLEEDTGKTFVLQPSWLD